MIEAYREVDIDVLETESERLPFVSLDALKTQYPESARLLDNPQVREAFGIRGDGPWAVVLAGYVLNSLDRLEAEIRLTPYRASVGDEFFPSRSSSSEPKCLTLFWPTCGAEFGTGERIDVASKYFRKTSALNRSPLRWKCGGRARVGGVRTCDGKSSRRREV